MPALRRPSARPARCAGTTRSTRRAASPISRSARMRFRARCVRWSATGSGAATSARRSVRRRAARAPASTRRSRADASSRRPICSRLLSARVRRVRRRFRRTAIGWRGPVVLRRNAAVALGNALDRAAVPALERALAEDRSPLVRGHAAWALGRIGSPRANLSAFSGVGGRATRMMSAMKSPAPWNRFAGTGDASEPEVTRVRIVVSLVAALAVARCGRPRARSRPIIRRPRATPARGGRDTR